MRKQSPYKKTSIVVYGVFRFFSGIISKYLYNPQVIRNEIKNIEGPFILIANHQSALDAMNIVIQYKGKLRIVFGNNYYYSLSKIVQKLADACGVIHKQQFQSQLSDLIKIKNVIRQGEALLIFPAGLMCEDGLSTPVPEATASFLNSLRADIYMARLTGTYFVMPKWSSKNRRGKTKIDIYKLLSSDELITRSESEIKEVLDEAMYFDAYKDQEQDQFTYKNGENAEGLENVVYHCPVCKNKYTIKADYNRLSCSACGFTQTMDNMGFLHCENSEQEVRHVSEWAEWILRQRKLEIGPDFSMTTAAKISVMDGKGKGFRVAGEGTVILNNTSVILDGVIDGIHQRIEKSVRNFPSLPFVPGKRFEIQHGNISYRCFPDNPETVMEWINTLKILHKA